MPRRAMPRVVVIVEHQDPTDVASLNRTEPRTPRSATCCSVALGSAGACDPCNARAAHAVHACAANATLPIRNHIRNRASHHRTAAVRGVLSATAFLCRRRFSAESAGVC